MLLNYYLGDMETTQLSRKVYQGICGWSDPSLTKCGKYFPPKISTSVEKLEFYSKQGGFPCVEVNSSSYTILARKSIEQWVSMTPDDFVFHFKSFGLFNHQSIDGSHLPADFLDSFQLDRSKTVHYESISIEAQREIWDRFNRMLLPVENANKLGCIVFQFSNEFSCNEKNQNYIKHCASMLQSSFLIAIEFRNRSWISSDNLSSTVSLLRNLRPNGACLIASDDLQHELLPFDQREEIHLRIEAGEIKLRIPMEIHLSSSSCSDFAYVRIHRRCGQHRILTDKEIDEWRNRIVDLWRDHQWNGKVYVLWGTDFDDQPIMNAKHLFEALPLEHRLDYRQYYRKLSQQKSIQQFFLPQKRKSNE